MKKVISLILILTFSSTLTFASECEDEAYGSYELAADDATSMYYDAVGFSPFSHVKIEEGYYQQLGSAIDRLNENLARCGQGMCLIGVSKL